MDVGIDITYKEHYLNHELQLAHKILTPHELALFEKSPDPLRFLMGRYAAKEAFLKANGKGLFEISFTDIEILNDESGAPHIYYQGKEEFDVSLSHDGDYAVAIVIRRNR